MCYVKKLYRRGSYELIPEIDEDISKANISMCLIFFVKCLITITTTNTYLTYYSHIKNMLT